MSRLFQGGKSKESGRTEVGLDAGSQGYVNQQRQQAQAASDMARNQDGSFFTGPLQQTPAEMAAKFMNPYQDQVIGGIRGEFDHLRNLAARGTNQDATRSGAYGGSRHALTEGARLGELDRAQTSQIGQFLNQGYDTAMGRGTQFAEHQRQLQQQQMQEPLFRQQQAQQFMNMGLGPTGQVQTQYQPGGSALGSAAGGAMTGFAAGGPVGAAIGGGLGLLGGLFG